MASDWTWAWSFDGDGWPHPSHINDIFNLMNFSSTSRRFWTIKIGLSIRVAKLCYELYLWQIHINYFE